MTDHGRLQIEMAAQGCISGTLDEWPHLGFALKEEGVKVFPNTEALPLREICKLLLEREGLWKIDARIADLGAEIAKLDEVARTTAKCLSEADEEIERLEADNERLRKAIETFTTSHLLCHGTGKLRQPWFGADAYTECECFPLRDALDAKPRKEQP